MLSTTDFCNRCTRCQFNERLINLICCELVELPKDDIDRDVFSTVLSLMLDGKPYNNFLINCGETYFQENNVRNSFFQPLDWHYVICKEKTRCECLWH